MSSQVIRISNQIFARLQKLGEPFTDTPASVIERVLDFYENNYDNTTNDTSKKTEDNKVLDYSDYVEFKASDPPNLKHTEIEVVILDTKKPYKTRWNTLVRDLHCLAMEKAQSFDALQLVTNFNIKQGEFTDNGFQYIPEINVSIQGVDTNRAWQGILELTRKLNIKIEVYFHWKNKDEVQFANKKGVLKSVKI
jgi:hypothetical protein